MSKDDRIVFLKTVRMFAEMDDGELARLAGDLRRRSLLAGETLFFQGDPGHAVYILESGTVRIYVHAEDGQEVSVVLYGAGDLFGEMSLLDQLPRSATAVATEDAVLWVMSDEDFCLHLRTSPQLALNVMLTLSTRLRETNEAIKSLASLDVTRRIANLISASRESTNRALRALQRKGLIDWRDGHVIILQPGELSNLVGSDETWW